MKFRYIALIIVLFLGTSVFAITGGSVTVSGTVPEAVYLSLSSNQINLKATQDSDSFVAVTTLSVWSSGHWIIGVESKNGGYLLNSEDFHSRIHYLFTLGTLTQSPVDLGSFWTSEAQSPTSSAGLALPLAILLQTEGRLIAEGTYEDMLTINIKQF
jgi:hypothetical protein